jgi:hypothetical protein
MKNRNTIFTKILLLIGCCGILSQKAFGVVPAPDGGYSGGNTAEGQSALFSLTTGTYNTAVGFLSLRSNTAGGSNTAIGAGALLTNYNSSRNTATGAGSLLSNSIGEANTANGALALLSNIDGGYNTAVGDRALTTHTSGYNNTAIGASALFNDTTGTNNTAHGAGALFSNTTGNNNTALGNGAGSSVTTANNVISIGTNGSNVDNSCYIANIYLQGACNAPLGVSVGKDNKLGICISSRRYKNAIKPMANASKAILAFKPVTFHYKTDNTATRQFGLIAEDVAEVNPDLVVRDQNGEPVSVRYDAVNAMLLNEFLKQHKAFVQEQCTVEEQGRKLEKQARIIEMQGRTITQLQKQIETAVVRLEEQDSKIQRVSDQFQASEPSPQMVASDR